MKFLNGKKVKTPSEPACSVYVVIKLMSNSSKALDEPEAFWRCNHYNAVSHFGLFLDCFRHSWKQSFSFQNWRTRSSSVGKWMDSATGSTMAPAAKKQNLCLQNISTVIIRLHPATVMPFHILQCLFHHFSRNKKGLKYETIHAKAILLHIVNAKCLSTLKGPYLWSLMYTTSQNLLRLSLFTTYFINWYNNIFDTPSLSLSKYPVTSRYLSSLHKNWKKVPHLNRTLKNYKYKLFLFYFHPQNCTKCTNLGYFAVIYITFDH